MPGNKAIYRVWTDKSDKASFDLIALEGEVIDLGNNTFYELSKEKAEVHHITQLKIMNEYLPISEFSKTLKESKKNVLNSMK